MGFGIGSAEYLKGRGGSWLRAAICTGGKEQCKSAGIVTAKEYCSNNTGALHQPIHLSNAYSVFPSYRFR